MRTFPATTRFEQWIRTNHPKPAWIARYSGYSRQHLLRVRKGLMDPTTHCVKALVLALRTMGFELTALDIFDLGD